MDIQAAHVLPSFHQRRALVAEDLRRLEDPVVLFECEHADSDGETAYIYTVAGVLDGVRLEDGCTVRGEVILIHADSREEADAIACMGLIDTINALDGEEQRFQEAHASLARLSTIGAIERMDLAMKPDADRNEAFEKDMAAVRTLAGDDIVLAAGRVEEGQATTH